MRIDVHGARLIARVDDSQEEVYLKGLNHDTNYGVSTNLPSVVLVGGNLIFLILKFLYGFLYEYFLRNASLSLYVYTVYNTFKNSNNVGIFWPHAISMLKCFPLTI